MLAGAVKLAESLIELIESIGGWWGLGKGGRGVERKTERGKEHKTKLTGAAESREVGDEEVERKREIRGPTQYRQRAK